MNMAIYNNIQVTLMAANQSSPHRGIGRFIEQLAVAPQFQIYSPMLKYKCAILIVGISSHGMAWYH